MRHLSLFLASGLAALASQSHAQQAIPDTIVTATRIPTPAERVPAAITVITRQDIEERGYQSLAEALTAVPGINLVGQGGLGGQTSAFTRGTNSSHTLVLLDGVPINDASTPAGAFNFGQDLLGNLDRIEVVRGPAASLYGSAALGGAINLVTRQAPQGGPGARSSPLRRGRRRQQFHHPRQPRRHRPGGGLRLPRLRPVALDPRLQCPGAAAADHQRRARRLPRPVHHGPARLDPGRGQPAGGHRPVAAEQFRPGRQQQRLPPGR
ncbi:TonB-dependent receptor [Paeniroseomonas aquatica]|uniref:TonB-dependent receptor n=1 Tax=Paeniroseomonas aquatica TaxID=373043 RepID=UPI00360A72DC